MKDKQDSQDDSDRESRRILDRATLDSETVGSSSLARSAEKTRDHFLGKDADPDDAIEVWGRRIGRGLSIVITVVLIIYLYNTFIA